MSLLRKSTKTAAAAASSAPAAVPSAFPPPPPSAAVPAAMWIDKYAPQSSKDLAMHKKKVDEVRDWLKKADVSLQLGLPPSPRLLVLSGPSGTGKSAMLRVLGREMGYEMCEWVEPRSLGRELMWDDEHRGRDQDDGVRQEPRAAAFTSFLRDSLRTLSLCVEPASGSASSGGSSSNPPPSGSRRRLVILDELAPCDDQFGKPDSSGGSQRDKQIVRPDAVVPNSRPSRPCAAARARPRCATHPHSASSVCLRVAGPDTQVAALGAVPDRARCQHRRQ